MSCRRTIVTAMRSVIPLALVVAVLGSAGVLAAGQPHFSGRVILEWVEENPFVAAMRLVEEFSFTEASGRTWTVPADSIVDGRSMSPLFVRLSGHPFDSGFRKSAIVYDHAARDMSQPWHEAQRMFFEASTVEGILPIEAKVMYMLLYASGPRWEVRTESSCFRNCHTGESQLAWRPLVDDEPVVALASWVRSDDPSLEQIDKRVSDVILHPGPHIFGYVR